MATYTLGQDYSAATFDDVIINGYGERARIIGETPRGVAWIVQSELHDNVRRIVLKDTLSNRAKRIASEI